MKGKFFKSFCRNQSKYVFLKQPELMCVARAYVFMIISSQMARTQTISGDGIEKNI